jgi:hypothetical protein
MLKSRFETCGDKKSNHVNGWCGSGQVRSPGDFDDLDAPESRFLKPQVNHEPTGPAQINKQKKKHYLKVHLLLFLNKLGRM